MAGRSSSVKRKTAYRSEADMRSMYVYGNAAPKPEYEQKTEETVKRSTRESRQRQRRALYVNKGYVIFLAVAAALALIVCVNYVQLQSKITSRTQNIASMQAELADLREENNTRYNEVMDSVNLETVREKALKDLGMVYADKDQIVEYDNPAGDYIKQYEEIPEEGVLARADKAKN